MVASDEPERQVDALLQVVLARRRDRGDALRQQDQERDQNARKRRRRADRAATASTTSENFLASSTTASSEISSSTMLSTSIRPDRCASPSSPSAALADEVILVPDGLGVEEHAVEHDRYELTKPSWSRRIDRPRRRQRVVRHDQRDGRQHDQHAEIDVGAGDLKVLLAIAQAADEDAEADQAVADDHDDREHGIARQRPAPACRPA